MDATAILVYAVSMPEKMPEPATSPLPHLQVVAAVMEKDGRLLCAQRPDSGELAGTWEFPGGKVESGESHSQALEREIDEELGLGIQAGEHIITVEHRYATFSISLHAYQTTILSGEPHCTEHQSVRWLRVDDLRTLHWAPADLPIVELLMTKSSCPFCSVPREQRFYDGPLVFGIWDSHPASPGHALLIPKRHVPTWFDATPAEQAELFAATAQGRSAIEATHAPDGYNLGVNIGAAAGQTVFHLHVHMIPRYAGDVARPRGGVRHVVPGRGE